ncbi:MAG TPA: thioesterase domain-containing protein, partial [Pseudonocardiaceae bacterium]
VTAFVALLDGAALPAMLRALRASGLFASPAAEHTLADVLATARVAPRHHRLVRRWLRALTDNDLLTATPTGWRLTAEVEDHQEQDWARVRELAAAVGPDHGAEMVRYLQTCAERLPELLRDDLDPLALLFPEGRIDVAEGAYRDNVVARYHNRSLGAALRELAAAHPGRLRVLEVGAGVGGTTVDLMAAVDGHDVEYHFTDLSPFFFNEARKRFGDTDRVRYGVFDLNGDHRAQGMTPNSFDVLVCANVLHNARHADEAMARLVQLLRPGGWLLFIEATADSYPLMASMEFQEGLTGFTDERARTDRTFRAREDWEATLERVGAELVSVLPPRGHPLGALGQHSFVARVKTGRAPVDPEELARHLADRLPAHMLPAHTQVVDALPLTGNGKVDRRALARWLDTPAGAEARRGAEPIGERETRLAELWAALLGVPRVGRDDDFYAVGGDSLLAAQLVGRIREELPGAAGHSWDVLLRQLLRTPTVAGLAAWLDSDPSPVAGSPDAAAASALVTLAEADGGPATVLIHDGSGTIAPYRALVPELTGRVVGLSVPSAEHLLRHTPEVLIPRLAAEYAAELTASVPGPYHVVGYCMGGLLAAEVARTLTENGAEVAGLTVISSYRVPYLVEDDLLVEYVFARALGADPAALGFPADAGALARAVPLALAETPGRLTEGCLGRVGGDPGLDAVATAMRELAAVPPAERLAAITDAAGGQLGGHASAQVAWAVFRHSLTAVTRHQEQLYAGDITFLRQSGETQFMPGLRADMTEFWRELCLGELRVVDIAGDHFSCLGPAHAGAVAAALDTTGQD